eukprot:CAMPEP_0118680570 /NCGR_PEP_ID=MMETSP0800-20121206/4439_1 /TAXON_ID=210618 ORGANISM="Striatella unipunctata, Strain CCMP2910" /NCGR_SAMPLE_ID=MMETSP0800 /ASSEMBLY_ACC=CAM_ASM_000638 /LENGTH=686 /DNA_ID=CAMNT_0006576735 /DNA_START=186 /DNA_END=2246 /DNA_ORIENTATION=-
MKRDIPVVEAEREDGNMEYKRQVQNLSPSRFRSLTTQMSYRLDQGHGHCSYRLGVEDNGCHSLQDYPAVAESAKTIELIARSLNSVVIERVMIQNEITMGENGQPVAVEGEPIRFNEKPLLTDGNEIEDSLEAKENSTSEGAVAPRAVAGVFTRCELSIHRVETHLLDPPPQDMLALAKSMSAVAVDDSQSTINGAVLSSTTGAKADKEPSIRKPIQQTPPAAAQSSEKHSVSETLSSRNIRVAVVGNVDAGKSTLIGTLTTSSLDDGRGKSRTSIMKHRHEIESGRTSTATTHLMGFRSTGEPIGGKDTVRGNKRKSEDEVAREAYRVVTLIDLAGHEKYLKTTIHGVSSGMADYGLIMVNSRQPPTHMTQHHLNLCCSFGIPVIVIFTKIDGCPPHAMKNCKEEVLKLLRAPEIGKKPFAIKNEADLATCMGKLHTLAPLIDTSCVTGQGIELLQKLLFSLPKRRRHENKVKRPFEFLVEDIFNVPGVGAVVSGFVNAGELTVGSNCNVYVGPKDDGTFMKTVAKSAHIARISTQHITAGQSACLAFSLNKELRKKLRRGMVVMKDPPTSTKHFEAEICVLKGEGTTIRRSYQAYVHILNVRQSAFARHIEIVNNNAIAAANHANKKKDDPDGIVLRPGSRAKVQFEFAKRPEYIRPGMRMLFRDGRVRGVGIITGIPQVQSVV